jgi:hypothetical protein
MPDFGYRWFIADGNGDYRGRPDNALPQNKTVRYYNQVNDETGLGAVGTWSGFPIRVAKMSNFVVGYACERIGVATLSRRIAQYVGTGNDAAANLSWRAGEALARGSTYNAIVPPLVSNIWDKSDVKNTLLWPNISSTDNFRTYFVSPDERFITIGFVEETP